MEEKEIHDELASIRSLMERSSKFISLSGLSGILAGCYALIGAFFAYKVIHASPLYQIINTGDTPIMSPMPATDAPVTGLFYGEDTLTLPLLSIAVIVLIASVVTGFILSMKKAKRKGQPIWSKTSQSLLFHMATPLIAGGILIFILLFRGHYGIVAPTSLIFYGLSLVSASNFTFTMVKYLGLCEIALGLIAACLPGYGLLFWAFGFGVLHIIYGGMMYLKYDR